MANRRNTIVMPQKTEYRKTTTEKYPIRFTYIVYNCGDTNEWAPYSPSPFLSVLAHCLCGMLDEQTMARNTAEEGKKNHSDWWEKSIHIQYFSRWTNDTKVHRKKATLTHQLSVGIKKNMIFLLRVVLRLSGYLWIVSKPLFTNTNFLVKSEEEILPFFSTLR